MPKACGQGTHYQSGWEADLAGSNAVHWILFGAGSIGEWIRPMAVGAYVFVDLDAALPTAVLNESAVDRRHHRPLPHRLH